MKSFPKMFLASLTAGVTIIVILFIVVMVTFGALASLADVKPVISKNSILKIDFNAEIVERHQENPMGSFDWMTLSAEPKIGLNQIKEALEFAAKDENIKLVYLNFSGFQAAPASLKEIRNVLLNFKESGKPIYAYAEVYSQKALYLASVSDSVFISPAGLVELGGMSSNQWFLANTFSKLGIEPQIVRGSNNRFKSAVEPFMSNKMSDANRLQMTKLLNDIWDEYKLGIASSRNISSVSIQAMADEFIMQVPATALQNNLVDAVWFQDELDQFFMSKLNVDQQEDLAFTSLNDMISGSSKAYVSVKEKIAVIYANGDIVSGNGDHNTIGSNTTAEAIRKARLDENVKAIVLRVNSPGGSAMASEIIWRETVLAKKEKPFVVSMGDYAASGGYYISAAADTIVAQPNTITGSIGVFMMFFTAQELLEEKLGVHFETVKNGAFADLGALNRPLTETEYSKLQHFVDYTYGDFLGKVAHGRGLDSLYVDSIGQGRVWTGSEAVKIGLVDVLGGLDDAVAIAAKMANLEEYKIKTLPKIKSPIEELLKELTGEDASQVLMKQTLGNSYRHLEAVQKAAKNANTIQARMEYELILD